ncbi:MAG TPA: HAMP domain-containing sensor histidine kinase, partial [Acidimicrobiales bacterium]|nr:HAMP domain-containing sensor histidine kinase [Acidimicrobiales bacterium]
MRRRLVLVAVATTTMIAVAFVVPLGLLVREVARNRALAGAESQARALAPALVASLDPEGVASAVAATGAGGRMSVRLPDGSWVGPPLPPDRGITAALAGRAGSVVTATGARVLVPVVLGRRGTAVVVVEVPAAVLERGVGRSWVVLAGLAAGLLALAVVVADRLGRGLVRPVEDLARSAAAIGRGDLDARATPAGPPEVAAVGEAFNAMAERIRLLLAAERELVADLSHRLRTPLTRLRLDVEAMPARQPADLSADLDALEAEVDALIAEARAPSRPPARCDAAEVVAARAEFWSALAVEEGRAWQARVGGGPAPVAVSASDLAAAVDALLGNVFAHTPEGTGFSVAVEAAPPGTAVVVDDGGAGFPAAALERGV